MSDDPPPGSPGDMMDRLLAQETKIERLEGALAAMRERTIDECEAIVQEYCEGEKSWVAETIMGRLIALRAFPPPSQIARLKEALAEVNKACAEFGLELALVRKGV